MSESLSPVTRAFRVLDYVSRGGETTNLSAAARETGVNRLTLMRLVADLEDEGILERQSGGGHVIGTSFLRLASSVLAGHDLTSMARNVLHSLTAEVQMSSYLAVLDGADVSYLVRAVPDSPLVSNISIGSRVPAHLTTPGRMLLSHLPPSDLEDLLGPEPLRAATSQSPTTYVQLRTLLENDRTHGFAWSFSGYEPGIDSCASHVPGPDGTALAAISVAGPDSSFANDTGLRERVELAVVRSAAELSSLVAGLS